MIDSVVTEWIHRRSGGKVHVVHPDEIPRLEMRPFAFCDIRRIRLEILDISWKIGLDEEDASGLSLALVEALVNADRYGKPPYYYGLEVNRDSQIIRAQVQDQGTGIPPELLPPAILRRGFSTHPTSLGQGFNLMMCLTDRITLATGQNGTIVQLELAA